MGLFGKSKKSELPPLSGSGGYGGIDMPPPPVPPTNVDPDSLGSFGLPEPPKPINQEEVARSEMEMGPGGQNFPGLDKDWLNFVKNEAPSIDTSALKQEVSTTAPEVRPLEPEVPKPLPRINLDVKGPIFIEMDTFDEFIGEIGKLHVKLHMMDEMLARIGSLREKEGFELKRWHQGMDDLRRKLLYMDDALFESGR